MLPQKQPLPLMQTSWAQQINPILANLLVRGQLLTGIELINGTTVINHKLGRIPNGWFPVSTQGLAMIGEAAQQPNPTLTLTLVSSAAVTTGIWVF